MKNKANLFIKRTQENFHGKEKYNSLDNICSKSDDGGLKQEYF